MPIRVKQAVICEDVRREENGKLFLIGVFGSNIGINEFPANIILATTVWIVAEEAGIHNVRFAWFVDDIEKSGASAKIEIREPGVSVFRVQPVPIVDIEKPGHVSFRVKFSDQDWQIAETLPIVSRSAPNASPPPS